jgi:hypothetical protein
MFAESGVAIHTCDPSTWETETEEPTFDSSLDYIMRPYLKKTLDTNKQINNQKRKHLLGLKLSWI